MINKYLQIRSSLCQTAIVILVATLTSNVFADSESDDFKKLTAKWWQWALSIPATENPMLDATGDKCFVGQNGSTWFLAGVFNSVTAVRNCAVPEGKELFIPIYNSVNINAPSVCGQSADNYSTAELHASSAASINEITKVSVKVDGTSIKNVRRIQSKVFEVALPENNVFDEPCISLGGVPAGIFSPAVDEGFYVIVRGLEVGDHTLQFSAEKASGVVQDVTYNLTVVPVLSK